MAVISFAQPDRLRRYQEEKRWPFPVFADPDRTAYHAFDLGRLPWRRLLAPHVLRTYWRLWRKGQRLDAYGGDDIFQAGGDLLIDKEGRIQFAHRSHDPADRPSIEMIRHAVERSA